MLSPVRVYAPNITGMYSELFYTYSIHLNDRSLAPPSPEVMYAAPCSAYTWLEGGGGMKQGVPAVGSIDPHSAIPLFLSSSSILM